MGYLPGFDEDVFISYAHNDDDTRQRAFDEGAASFLYKPFDAAELLEAIRVALANSLTEG